MRIRNLSGYPMGLTIGVRKVSWLRSTKIAGIMCTCLFSLTLHGDPPISKEPVTITFVDPEWSKDLTERTLLADVRLTDFTQQTGIGVKHLPTPETTLDQLDLVRKLLRQESTSPDVDGVDVIWPGVLNEELMDLKPYLATELSAINADMVASYTVTGKLVAVPYHRLKIGRHLALCFAFLILMMVICDGVLLWQLRQVRSQVELLKGVDGELIEVS